MPHNNCEPLKSAKEAAKGLINSLYQGYDRAAVVTFDSQAHTPVRPGRPGRRRRGRRQPGETARRPAGQQAVRLVVQRRHRRAGQPGEPGGPRQPLQRRPTLTPKTPPRGQFDRVHARRQRPLAAPQQISPATCDRQRLTQTAWTPSIGTRMAHFPTKALRGQPGIQTTVKATTWIDANGPMSLVSTCSGCGIRLKRPMSW